MITFDTAYELLESILTGSTRHEIIDDLARLTDYGEALVRLRAGMRANTFKFGTASLNLDKVVKALDNQTREDGFHALNDWDGKANLLNKDIIPVDVLNYFLPSSGRPPSPTIGLAILLDYYFMYLLGLLALRAWDATDPCAGLDSVTRLLGQLQSPNGSGQRFADNAETLILMATSHFEPDDGAYNRLLDKVRRLHTGNQMNFAFAHAAILGSHLRFGFEPFYKRDLALMRADNGPDYPWLCFSLVTLMRAYAGVNDAGEHGEDRDKIVEGLLNGLTPDTRAFLGKPPASLTAYEPDLAEFRQHFRKYREDLIAELELRRPTDQQYSPIAFNFNFPHNILKAVVVNAVARGQASTTSINDLLSGFPQDDWTKASKYALLGTLLEYARISPETIRGRSFPMVVYDPLLGFRNFTKAMTLIKELSAS